MTDTEEWFYAFEGDRVAGVYRFSGAGLVPLPAGGALGGRWDGQNWLPPAPTADDVKEECRRRLMRAFGKTSREDLENAIRDANEEATALLDERLAAIEGAISNGKALGKLPAQKLSRASGLRGAKAIVDAHDQASKALRAMDPIPADFADDKYWPPNPA
ncbi:MAG: hypothetical protein H6873_05680 [Hyphomicrobiaceae bacterium]|nr:hypothetical protein [Hyphomicrobiaceae bacterium]